jgi:hypothetical protein
MSFDCSRSAYRLFNVLVLFIVIVDRSVVQSASRRLLAYLYRLLLWWRLTPVMLPMCTGLLVLLYIVGGCCSVVVESRGLPRSHNVVLDRTSASSNFIPVKH